MAKGRSKLKRVNLTNLYEWTNDKIFLLKSERIKYKNFMKFRSHFYIEAENVK